MFRKPYHIHFIGIGGIGMSGIAELLLNLGYRVSGSDKMLSDVTARLQRLGGVIHEGHSIDHIADADVVVISSAVKSDNIEVKAALARSIPVIPRAEMLAELMRLKYSIAVAGAHGKTTTTSLLAAILGAGGLDPTVVIGGKLKSVHTNAVLGQGDYIVAEADESDGSFLKMSPTIAVVTNIDLEHLDFYKNMETIKSVFLDFIDRVPFYGLTVLCLDNAPIQDIIPAIKKRYVTYGLNAQADVQARGIGFEGEKSRFEVYHNERFAGDILLNLPGIHNISNALAGIAVGFELAIPFERIKAALETIEGVHRRLEVKGEVGGVKIIDDYGHHPTEIRTTLEAVRKSWPGRRLVVMFQPHRYTRTRDLFSEFTRAFYESDVLLLLPVYAAGETAIEGADAPALHAGIKMYGHKDVCCLENMSAGVDRAMEILNSGDIFLTLGAGDVWKAGETLLSKLMVP
jgi:UDP-N-acetylmuramate--alanine ligase